MKSNCERCGDVFSAKPSRRQRFCSIRCALWGNTNASGDSLNVRFWTHVDRAGSDVCWFWRGNKNKSGYGIVGFSKRGHTIQVLAHRVAYELAVGPIPQGLLVLHSCDNPPCVNPKHLRVGTDADNVADMHARGRYRGGANKLQKEQVSMIRSLLAGGQKQASIAAAFRVHPSSISNIKRGANWRSV